MGMVWQVSSDKWKAPLVKVPHVWLTLVKYYFFMASFKM